MQLTLCVPVQASVRCAVSNLAQLSVNWRTYLHQYFCRQLLLFFFNLKISSHESLIIFFYNSLKNINEHILGLSPFVQGTTLCIFFKWGQTSILRSIKTRSVPVCNFKLASGHGRARSGHHNGAKRMWSVVRRLER